MLLSDDKSFLVGMTVACIIVALVLCLVILLGVSGFMLLVVPLGIAGVVSIIGLWCC